VCSADHYFIDRRTGVYTFDPAKIGEAHNSCFRHTLGALQDGCPFVVVDNTNCTLMECSPYVLMGTALGYDVEVITVLPPSTEVAAARNSHGVPEGTVTLMAANLEREITPGWWCARTVQSA
jgi:hypothetical protein